MRRGAPSPRSARFPRHPVLRVNDLLPPAVTPADVLAALAARGVPVGDRETPVGSTVRALVVPTGAGTLVTLERRGVWTSLRSVVLRQLTRLSEELRHDLRERAGTRDEADRSGQATTV